MASEENQAFINYYLKQKRYQQVLNYCDAKLKKSIGEPILLLWKSIALIYIGNQSLAIQELQPLEDKRDFGAAWFIAMIFAHQSCKIPDREAIATLQAKFTVANPSTTDRASLLAGLVCYHTGDTTKAIEYLKTALTKNANNIGAMATLGWIELEQNQVKNNWFDKTLEKSMRDLEGMFGKCVQLRSGKNSNQALDLSNRIIAYYPNFLPAYIERMLIFLDMLAWDSLLEAAQRLGGLSQDNVNSLQMICLYEVCIEGPSDNVAGYLETTFRAIERLESKNSSLILNIAKTFARLANRNSAILEVCLKLIGHAIQNDKDNGELYSEMGYILYLKGEYARSRECFEKASSLDPQNIEALEGIITWLISTEQYSAAIEQLEMFYELQKTLGPSARITYLNSVVATKYHKSPGKGLLYLQETLEAQLNYIEDKKFSFDYYKQINPDFVLGAVRDYMDLLDAGHAAGKSRDATLAVITKLLDIIYKIYPGSAEAGFYLAKTNLIMGDTSGAEKKLQDCIKRSKSNFKAYILLAEIYVENNSFANGLSALEMALSIDFQIRNDPSFLLLKAKCLFGQESYDDCINVLRSMSKLQPVKNVIKAIENRQQWSSIPTVVQISTMYLILVQCYSQTNAQPLVITTMQEVKRLFSGTEHENMFIIAESREKLKKEDVQGALDLLATIKPDQPTYLEARSLMADIYLNKKKDRKGYAKCFREVVEKRPTVDSCLFLGDAYLKIQQPEEAIAVYQSALKAYPNQTIFSIKIGACFVMMHEYSKAITYYKTICAKTNDKQQLQTDLVNLLLKLKRYDEANAVIQEVLEQAPPDSQIVKDFKVLMGYAYKGSELFAKASSAFLAAKDAISNHEKLSEICHELGQLAELEKDYDRASSYYVEASQHNQKNTKSLIQLTKLYLKQGNTGSAQAQLNSILSIDPNSIEASILMADLLFEKAQFESALFHYKQMLEQNPSDFQVVAKFIDVSKRMSKLELVPPILHENPKLTPQMRLAAGFYYCKGLYHRHLNELSDAMKCFIQAKRDGTFGEPAIHNLVEIFLNPNNETVGGEALEIATENSDTSETDLLGIITADKLLKLLPKTLETQILECHALMATKQKAEIEKAIAIQMDILSTEKDYIPALYGTSVGFLLLKQTPRARNQLKRISKMEWSPNKQIEKCWLLLADIYIQGGKYDLATELLKKIIQVDQSNTKAYEYLGFIMEKEQSYKDAAEFYLKSWSIRFDASIGYKLAFNYLKAKRYMDAIDICHAVLKQVPDYPKIKADILDKSRSSLRFP
ncbi:Tetratricopeptide repeat protein 21B [Boothiomyces macroporosus]|uniref:Tetratricopeptide repeat protein 21B n=1 Tax=Boothiomyces macroporosus TaxID=261099 RepID=A0AAD5UFI4_9FUNG|nr:Tetratricopeptide repeat protein 21B [Boothiomyces macroporosus]